MEPITCVVSSPLGEVGITQVDHQLSKLQLLGRDTQALTQFQNLSSPPKLLLDIKQWLDAYFKEAVVPAFDIPIQPSGTPFQQKVWQALREIPTGQTLTYGQLAKKLDSSPRAIGGACRRNPTPIVVPCHRVVSQTGVGGFMGEVTGDIVEYKSWLLRHESTR